MTSGIFANSGGLSCPTGCTQTPMINDRPVAGSFCCNWSGNAASLASAWATAVGVYIGVAKTPALVLLNTVFYFFVGFRVSNWFH